MMVSRTGNRASTDHGSNAEVELVLSLELGGGKKERRVEEVHGRVQILKYPRHVSDASEYT